MIVNLFKSKYLFFILLSFCFNIIASIYMGKNKLQIKEIIQCSIIEIIGIIFGAKIIDIIINTDVYVIYIKNKMYLHIFTGGYTFLGGAFFGFFSILAYSIIFKKNLKLLCNIFIPNLILIYSISKIGCFFNKCCIGISINDFILPIQLIESIVYLSIYFFVLKTKNSNYNKIYLSCILFGFFRFFLEFLREHTDYISLSISQVLSIFIFIIGIKIYSIEN